MEGIDETRLTTYTGNALSWVMRTQFGVPPTFIFLLSFNFFKKKGKENGGKRIRAAEYKKLSRSITVQRSREVRY